MVREKVDVNRELEAMSRVRISWVVIDGAWRSFGEGGLGCPGECEVWVFRLTGRGPTVHAFVDDRRRDGQGEVSYGTSIGGKASGCGGDTLE